MYLYHYTNLSSLAMILKNKTIKFNRLDFMDDLQEKVGTDIKNIGKYFFVSCWSDEPKESIPMWLMYTDIEQGVKLRFDRDFLKKYNYNEEAYKSMLPNMRVEVASPSPSFNIPLDFMIEHGIFSPQILAPDLLHKVEYTDEINNLEPEIFFSDENRFGLNFESIGKFKNLHWEFQREWRFIINILPFNMFDDPKKIPHKMAEITHNIRAANDNYKIPNSIFIGIKETALNNIEIIMSPKMNEGNKTILNLLIKEYCPNAIVKDSCLKDLI